MSEPTNRELFDLDTTQKLTPYLKELWARRDFLIVIPRQDARSRQMTTVLGQTWHLLNPMLMTLIYFVVFGKILNAQRGVDSYIAFLTIGVLFFQLCQRITQDAASVIPRNEGLIRSMQFPRSLLPLSIALQHLTSFGPAALVMIIVSVIDSGTISLRILVLPVAILAASLVSIGFAFFAARIGAFIHDLQELLPHVFRILLYFSGILFSIDSLIGNQLAKNILRANPIFDFVAVARWSLIGTPIGERVIVSLALWSILLPPLGLMWFRRSEHRYGG
jgi:teichoic acid transport system permease protein